MKAAFSDFVRGFGSCVKGLPKTEQFNLVSVSGLVRLYM